MNMSGLKSSLGDLHSKVRIRIVYPGQTRMHTLMVEAHLDKNLSKVHYLHAVGNLK